MSSPVQRPDNPDGRRHHLVILFTDVSNSTAIAAAMEPEQYALLLQSIRDLLSGVLLQHDGEIARIDGDGALCLFGYPVCHEDAARRATEAAIELHAAVDALGMEVPQVGRVHLHSGIHAGLVLLREGDLARGRFEVLGDATNVAARLSDWAKPGDIVVSEAALGADRNFFRTGAVQFIGLAGDRGPLPAFVVHGRHADQDRFTARGRDGLTPFAGRAAELARLRSWFVGGSVDPAIILGPPGIGKTRLLGEFLAWAADDGALVHRGYCEGYLGARPFQPFVQLAKSMDQSIGDAIDQAREPTAVAEMVGSLISRSSRAGRCLLAIDDWQWADGASRELLEALLATSQANVRFLLASRFLGPRPDAASSISVVPVPPLPDADAKAAATFLLRSRDEFVAASICEEAGGNPLFLEELCHAAQRRRAKTSVVAPSAWLDMLIQARFAQLPPEQAALVRTAAVIGPAIPTTLFSAVTGKRSDDPLVIALAEADFLYPGDVSGTLRFKHGIARDAIYRTIGLDERRSLHRRVVEALRVTAAASGGPLNVDALAHHVAASGDLHGAIPYAIEAGDAALAAGAVDRAQAHYRAAFESLAETAVEPEATVPIWKLVNKFGLACIADPSPEQMPVLDRMAIRMAALADTDALVRSRYWIGAIAYGLGDGRSSATELRAALDLAKEHQLRRLIPQIGLKLAQSLFASGDYGQAHRMFMQVLPEVEAGAGRNDREALAYGLCCHGFLLADQGDFAASDRRYAQAAPLLADASAPLLASCLSQMAAVSLMRGEWQEALAGAERCVAVCGPSRARYQENMARAIAAYARWMIDRDPDAVETLSAAADWFAADASRQRTSLLYGWLADVLERSGDRAGVRHHAARAIRRVRDGGDRLGECMAYHAMARLASREGHIDRANRYLDRATRSAAIRMSPRDEALTEVCSAELAVGVGDGTAAATSIGRASSAFIQMGAPALAAHANLLLVAS